MNRRLAWAAGAVVTAAAALRALRRRTPVPAGVPEPDPRAQELRRKLEESRALVEERDEFESGETTVDVAEPPSPDPRERRREVHEQGRAAAEQMRAASED